MSLRVRSGFTLHYAFLLLLQPLLSKAIGSKKPSGSYLVAPKCLELSAAASLIVCFAFLCFFKFLLGALPCFTIFLLFLVFVFLLSFTFAFLCFAASMFFRFSCFSAFLLL